MDDYNTIRCYTRTAIALLQFLVFDNMLSAHAHDYMSGTPLDPPHIELSAVLAESAPGMEDGAMIILVSIPAEEPYVVLLNGEEWGEPLFGSEITITDLAAGAYTVQVVDLGDNFSNVLEVVVPLNPPPDPRVANLKLEPIIYEAGPSHPPGTHAWITFDMLPGEDLQFFNLGVAVPANSVYWYIRNLPIPPLINVQTVSYRINIEEFDPLAPGYTCEYHVGPEWYSGPDFPASVTVDLVPMPTTYHVGSGSDDPVLSLPPVIIPPIIFPPPFPGNLDTVYRGCDVPNIDLDSGTFYPPGSSIPSDHNACGPAAAGNSLHWLVQQHPELSHDMSSLRAKVDSLKKYMSLGSQNDGDGVRFDSMVVGKLTLIDKLQLPIRVKYKTKHESGNTDEPLASLDPTYGHVADNQGALGVYPDFDWYKQEMDDGEDVEVHVGWYGPPDVNGNRTRNGGHWLVATGYFACDAGQGVWLKDDADQSATDPDSLKHEYHEWDTLAGGIPYLVGLSDSDGRVAIVESLVSESYDPNIVFTDVSQYDWTYKPVIYLSGDNLSDPFHAWLQFEHPVVPQFQYLNMRMINPANGMSDWLVKNFPLAPNATPRPIHYRINMRSISELSGPPSLMIAELSLGTEFVTDDAFPYQSALVLSGQPQEHFVPSGSPVLAHIYIPKFPLEPDTSFLFDTIYGFTRECVVPNIDLDSVMYPDDINSCAAAATANSLKWLMDEHFELLDIDSLRGLLDSLKALMGDEGEGVQWDTIVMGKLAFIDKYQLPIRVKYQVHTPYPGFKPIIKSPDTTYGHAAENKTGTNKFPQFEWICSELEAGEDVEMNITYWCDSSGVRVLRTAHTVNVTGYFVTPNTKWLTWKHDTRQDTTGGTVEEYGRWCVDSVGYPFLKEMSETEEGCIAYVGSVISESYDPNIVFDDVTGYDWMYKPIVYLAGGVEDDPFQAWLVFNLPVDHYSRFLNVKMCNPVTGAMHWILQNVPLIDRASPMPVRIKIDLRPLVTGDTVPANLIMKYNIGEFQTSADFPIQSYAELAAWPALYLVPSGARIGPHPLIPKLPAIPLTPLPPYIIEYIQRGCEVPNIDLDSLMYPVDSMNLPSSDYMACGPAAAANSLQWLDDKYEEIDIPLELRAILDTLKQMMDHDPTMGGVEWPKFIEGKLEFIDRYHLPIKVKYQAHPSAPAEIPSPNPLYGHKATNESPPDPNKPGKYLHPTFEWLCQELMEDEDVEMWVGRYCDTEVLIIDTILIDTIDGMEVRDTIYLIHEITTDTLDDGTIVMDTSYLHPKIQRKSGHIINVNGKMEIGPLKWITYKHDPYQEGPGGPSPDGSEDYPFTDISEWLPATGGYAIIPRESYIAQNGDTCTAYVESTITESYDPEIDFCPEKVCFPEDDGEGTLRRALLCAEAGDIITLGLDVAGDTIGLTSGPLIIDKDVTIIADPNLNIYIMGENVNRVFEIQPGVTVTFEGLRIICGEAADASCVLNEGTVIFRDTQFFNHDGFPGTSSQIVNKGTMTIEGSTNLRID